MALPPPLALTPCLPAELLSYILQQTHPTTIIICGTRPAFLSSLLETTSLPPLASQAQQDPDPRKSSQPLSPSNAPSHTQEEPSTPLSPPLQGHPLLTQTLHQISLSRHITIAFIPTVSHLRAYLSVFSAPKSPPPTLACQLSKSGSHGTHAPLLLVYGLVELHRETSEWSTQGLGNTCAAVVEAGRSAGRRVVCVEERVGDEEEESAEGRGGGEVEEADYEGDDDNQGGLRTSRARKDKKERGGAGIWHEKLPILSGSVRRAGAEAEYGGRTVEVGTVLRRWFKFGRGEWDDDGYG